MREQRKLPSFLTQDDFDSLVKVISSKRDRALIFLAYSHGLRASEVIQLKRDDVDLKNGRISINRKKGSLSSIQPLNATSKRYLKSYLNSRKDELPYSFISNRERPFDRSTARKMLMKYAHQAELPRDKQKFHVLKHSIATHLLEETGDVMFVKEWLGHASIQSTMFYAQLVSKKRDEIATKTFELMGI